jgi:hypothetical protein
MSLYLQSGTLYEKNNLNWVVKQDSWFPFSQLAKTMETSFPTLDSVVDEFTHTMLRVFKQSIPWSYTKPYCVLVPWWMEEYQDAVQTQEHALRSFRWHPSEANVIAFKHLHARVQRTV